MRLIVFIGLVMMTSASQSEDWRTTDWSHKIVSEGASEEYRTATTESFEFYQGGKSKAALTIPDAAYFALVFWTYRLELGFECTYKDFTLTIDDDLQLAIEVEELDSGAYMLRPLGVTFPPSTEIAEWDKGQFKSAFGVSQRIHLTVIQDCSGYPMQPQKLDLTFSLRGGRAAIEFVEGG